jgi:hypothetical protein
VIPFGIVILQVALQAVRENLSRTAVRLDGERSELIASEARNDIGIADVGMQWDDLQLIFS